MDTTASSSSSNNPNKSQDNSGAAASSELIKDLMTSNSSSWTILPADHIEVLDSTTTAGVVEACKGEEPDESSGEPANERCPPVAETDAQAEDFSDGISIISDCESTGRLTPSPTPRALLNDLNTSFELGNDLPPTPNHHAAHSQQLRMRRQQLQEAQDTTDGDQPKQPAAVAELNTPPQSNSVMGYRLPAVVQSGLTAVFYVCCTLAMLAFVGRLRNPEWQMLGDDKQLAQLEQRLVDLELQNNLMRAEIDIMSKQLNYLSGQPHAQPPASSSSTFQGRKLKTFKAWPGNGNSGDPVDITKQDLKRPYKCADGKFVEIAGMCVESKPHAESLADEIGNVVNDVLQQSQAFHNFEKLTEQLGTLAGAGDDEASETPSTAFHAHDENANTYNANRGKERYQGKKWSNEQQARFKSNEYEAKRRAARSNSNEHDSDENGNENSKERKQRDKSNEHTRYKSNEHDSDENENSKERKQRDKSNEHSKEHTRYKSNEHDSKERHHKKYADKSKERYGKKQQQHRKQHDDDDSGEWHERMMQHRENARQHQDQKRNNNWFIERSSNREQRRSGEDRR
ncbi:hypothetical protein KR093_006296 [Drosophila rubida]|uniref:Uncharacterized protein n=1 Tax=Drosophila rubida TaxID=30044 RepID=A0AAD4KB65_9MUSC|nr:hypothetical protein KR093_006296 [Drosophila rubida]